MTKTTRIGFSNTIISYSGVLLGYVNVAILFPKFFAPEQLGLRSVLMEFSAVLAQFSILGFSGVVNKYFPFYNDSLESKKKFLSLILVVPLAGFLFFSIIVLLFKGPLFLQYKNKSPLIYEFYYLIFPITLSMLYSTILEIYSSFFNPLISTILRELVLRISSTVLIILYVMNWISIDLFWYLFAGSYALSLLLLVLYLVRIGEFKLKITFPLIEKEIIRPMISFTLFGFLLVTATSLVLKLDTIMIVYILKDLTATGIYALSLYIASLVEIPKRALVQVTNPLLSSAFKNNDLETVKSLYLKTCLNQLIAGLFIFLLIVLNIDEIYSIIPKKEIYGKGIYAVIILCAAKLTDLATGNNGEIINYSDYYKAGFKMVLALIIIAAGLNYVLLPIYGITGAAIATLISFIIFNLSKFVFILVKFNFQPFNYKTLQVIGLGIITFGGTYLLPKTNWILLDIFLKSVVIFILFLIPIIVLKISPEITFFIDKFLLKIRSKKRNGGKV